MSGADPAQNAAASMEKEVVSMKKEVKGYYTDLCYWGWVGDHYMAFASEADYLDYIRESD